MPDELLLRGCYRTTGIHDTKLDIEGRSCHLYDVDGRRSERKKWLNYFQDVDTIIFVVSLTGYCQALPENVNANQMLESLALFESIIKLEGFGTVPIILMLNKFDLLEHRMRNNPIVDYYPEYSGDSNPLHACRFIATKFSQLDHRPHGSLRMMVTSVVEDDDFKSTIDELWPDLFRQGLAIIPEAPK
ncbi:hypothetical protein HO133_006531 [Letharia lupina]|uniref:G protein alpha subunit n=1 Tax=Letharia lupina TaxID=560253 RepID=A0A8H6C6W4_9LECA|nr:uncharacterized protein HO133_006531 [Letharia lupina]KAF6217704.1 hypothetical protein HO133_006531 [Letharia lupina]